MEKQGIQSCSSDVIFLTFRSMFVLQDVMSTNTASISARSPSVRNSKQLSY